MPVSLPIPAAHLARNTYGVQDLHPPSQVPLGWRPPSSSPAPAMLAHVFLDSLPPSPLPVAPLPGLLDLAVCPPSSLSRSDRLPSSSW
jgi:hypothetical protein